MSEIPIVDISRAGAATLLGRALEHIGFAYITGHGIPVALSDGAFVASRAFHASSLERKHSLAINAAHRGYMAMATSTIVTSRVARVTQPNLSESLMLMHEVAAGDPRLGEPLQGPNQYPDWLPGFRAPIDAYIEAVEDVARRVIQLIAAALDLPETALDRYFARPTTFLRLLHYPPHPDDASDDQFGSAPHTDYGIITLLAQDDRGGLEVRPRGGDWIAAPPIPGSLVLNVADMLVRWTNDRFVSTPHRVLNAGGGDRYSIPFFFDTDMDALIECLPTCHGATNPARYDPVRYGDYLMDRLDRNYAYRKSRAAE